MSKLDELAALEPAMDAAHAALYKDVGEPGENYRAYIRAKHDLREAAVNALPALLAVASAAKRMQDARNSMVGDYTCMQTQELHAAESALTDALARLEATT
jgi:hypothetical protein